MNLQQLITELKKIKRTKVFGRIPDYESSYFLYDFSKEYNQFQSEFLYPDKSNEEFLKNIISFRFYFNPFDKFICDDNIEFFIHSEETETRDEAYESLAQKILSLNTVFNAVVMNKVFEHIKYAAYRDKIKD